MRRKFTLLVLVLVFSFDAGIQINRREQPPNLPQPRPSSLPLDTQTRARVSESYGKLPLSFEANQGQAGRDVKFLSRGHGYQLSLKATEAVLELRNAECGMRNEKTDGATGRRGDGASQTPQSVIRNPQSAIVKMQLVNANPAPQMAGRDKLPGKSHYYIGNDPKDWRTNVATYAKVEYEQVWPGINLVYYGNQRQLEYDFIVAPGADPNAIHFTFDGAAKVKLDAQGNLVLHVAGGEVVLQKPFVYQEVNGARQQIAGNYQIRNPQSAIHNREVGFHVGAYDTSLPLVIDPVLVYSTYLGPASRDIANDIAVDQAGNVYITGASFFISEGWNAFVAKLNATGTMLVYSTAFIGGKDEIGFGVAVDAAGNAYATGYTRSTNFPVKNAFQPRLGATDCRNVLGCSDAFVAKLDAAGTIVYSTYLGGNDIPGDQAAGGDLGCDIAVDGSGQAYVTGYTISQNFPVKNAFQPTGNADNRGNVNDGFLTKFSASGTELIYSTYLGGTGIDDCTGIAIDAAGNAYVTGATFGDQTNNFPTTTSAFQRTAPGGGRDSFVTKLNAAGNALVYSTYLGGNNSDQGEGIAVDSAGNAYVIGKTDSTNFPLDGAHQAVNLGGSAFVTKLNPSGSGLLYSSYLGKQVWTRTGTSPGAAIAVDAAGMAYVIGSTSVTDFPVVNALYPTFGGGPRDAYIAKINTVTKTVVYATYLGGSVTDYGYGIALDAAGNVYVTGETNSANFPLKNPLQPTLGSSDFNSDTFVTKIGEEGGPCQTLGLQAADPEQAQDTLQIADAQPGNGTPISGALLKIGGLKVTVRYLLQTRANAVLKVRLYDEEGRERAALDGEIDIARPQSCPNPLPTREFNVVPRTVDFTPLFFGSVPTSLKLTAQMLDAQTGGIFKSAELTYRVLPDVIAFEGTPSINGQAAPDGGILPGDGRINFTCALRYQLANDTTGKLRVQALLSDGSLLARKDVGNVVPTAQPTVWTTPLDFQFSVPESASQIRVVVSLLAGNEAVLKSSTPLIYSRLRIQAGSQSTSPFALDPSFHPFPPDFSLRGGGFSPYNQILNQRLTIKVTDALPEALKLSRFAVRWSERLYDGTLIHSREDSVQQKDDFPHPSFYTAIGVGLSLDGAKTPDDVDKWELQLVIFPPNDAPLIQSNVVTVPITRVRITSSTPPIDRKLPAGQGQEFVYILAYHLPEAAGTISAEVTYIPIQAAPKKETVTFQNGAKAKGAGSKGERFTLSLDLPPDLGSLRIQFKLKWPREFGQVEVETVQKIYNNIAPSSRRVGAGAGQTADGPGVKITTLENDVERAIQMGRSARDAKNAARTGTGSSNGNLQTSTEPHRHASETAAEGLTNLTLFRDFIGVNATWELAPPIPINGGFIADLQFSYRAEDLPDDPNFIEAAMKVIGFDPATGQLVSYPTTVNLSSKTATARVNGLLPLYSLGVFGPFAQRSLNFSVLRNYEDIATRFNLINAGTPNAGNGDAALTLRAYNDAGANLEAANLVNPLTSTLAAARMLTGSVSDLFKSTAPLEGWVQTRANRNTVAGYELLTSGNRFDGLNAPSGYDSALILPEAVYDATQTTEVHLANATNFSGVVTLELRNATGQLAGSEEITLVPKARFVARLQDIFTNLAQPFTGYLLILSERDLAAAAVQVLDKEISALNAQPLGSGATRLYAPYLSLGGPTQARLTLVNPTTQSANLMLRLINNPGAPTTAPVNFTLSAGQQLQRNFSQLFDFDPFRLAYSTLIVESNTAGLAGNVTLFGSSAAIPFRATMPLESAPANRLVFAHLNTSDGFYTELGIFNPSAQAARVTLACFKPDGASLGQASFNVAAGAVFGNFLNELVNGANRQAAGYFTLTSDQPIVAGAAFGTDVGSALAALPPQILPTTNTNALASVSAASYQGQTLAANSIVAAFGVNLSNGIVAARQVPLPTTLADTTIVVRDSLGVERLAPLFFVSPGQINYLMPSGMANGAATVTATNGAGALSLGNVTITNVAPGLFAANANGQGVPAAVALRVKADGAQSYETIARFDAAKQLFVSTSIDLGPAGERVFLLLFGTGLRGRSSLGAATASLGGINAQVLYVGAQGDLVGLDQVNVELPRALAGRGEVDIVLTVDGRAANIVRANIR